MQVNGKVSNLQKIKESTLAAIIIMLALSLYGFNLYSTSPEGKEQIEKIKKDNPAIAPLIDATTAGSNFIGNIPNSIASIPKNISEVLNKIFPGNIPPDSKCINISTTNIDTFTENGIAEAEFEITNECGKPLFLLNARAITNDGILQFSFINENNMPVNTFIKNNEGTIFAENLNEKQTLKIKALFQPFSSAKGKNIKFDVEIKASTLNITTEKAANKGETEIVEVLSPQKMSWHIKAVNFNQCIFVDKTKVLFGKEKATFTIDASKCNADNLNVRICEDPECKIEPSTTFAPANIIFTKAHKRATVNITAASAGAHQLKIIVEPKPGILKEIGTVTITNNENKDKAFFKLDKHEFSLFNKSNADSTTVVNDNLSEVVDVKASVCDFASSYKQSQWYNIPDTGRGKYIEALKWIMPEIKQAAAEAAKIGMEKNSIIIKAVLDGKKAHSDTNKAFIETQIMLYLLLEGLEGGKSTEIEMPGMKKVKKKYEEIKDAIEKAKQQTDIAYNDMQVLEQKAMALGAHHECAIAGNIQGVASEAKKKEEKAKKEVDKAKELHQQAQITINNAINKLNRTIKVAESAVNNMQIALEKALEAYDFLIQALEAAAIDNTYTASEDHLQAAKLLEKALEAEKEAKKFTIAALKDTKKVLELIACKDETGIKIDGCKDSVIDFLKTVFDRKTEKGYSVDVRNNLSLAIKDNKDAGKKAEETKNIAAANYASCSAICAMCSEYCPHCCDACNELGPLSETQAAAQKAKTSSDAATPLIEDSMNKNEEGIKLVDTSIKFFEDIVVKQIKDGGINYQGYETMGTIPAQKQAIKSQEKTIKALEGDEKSEGAIKAAYYLANDEKPSTEDSKYVGVTNTTPDKKLAGLIGTYVSAGFVRGAFDAKDPENRINLTQGNYELVSILKERCIVDDEECGCDNLLGIKLIDFIIDLKKDKLDIEARKPSIVTINWSTDDSETFGVYDKQISGIKAVKNDETTNSQDVIADLRAIKHVNSTTIGRGQTFANFNVPDDTTQPVTEVYNFKLKLKPEINRLARKENNTCIKGILEGSNETPKISLDWKFENAMNGFCDSSTGNYCDTTQSIVNLSYKVKNLNDFLIENAAKLKCPTNPANEILNKDKPQTYRVKVITGCWLPKNTKTYDGFTALYWYANESSIQGDISAIENSIMPEVRIMRDSVSTKTMEAFEKAYQSNAINLNTPTWYKELNLIKVFNKPKESIVRFSDISILPDSGTYRVRLEYEFDESWKPKNSAIKYYLMNSDNIDSLFYYMPLDLPLKELNFREAGITFSKLNVPINANENFQLKENALLNEMLDFYGNFEKSTENINDNLKYRGFTLNALLESPKKGYFDFMQTVVVPVNMSISQNANNTEDISFGLYTPQEKLIYFGNNFSLWGIDNCNEAIPDTINYIKKSKMFSIYSNVQFNKGKQFNTIFYLIPGQAFFLKGLNDKISFNGKTSAELTENTASEKRFTSIKEVFDKIKTGKMCLAETTNSSKAYWNVSKADACPVMPAVTQTKKATDSAETPSGQQQTSKQSGSERSSTNEPLEEELNKNERLALAVDALLSPEFRFENGLMRNAQKDYDGQTYPYDNMVAGRVFLKLGLINYKNKGKEYYWNEAKRIADGLVSLQDNTGHLDWVYDWKGGNKFEKNLAYNTYGPLAVGSIFAASYWGYYHQITGSTEYDEYARKALEHVIKKYLYVDTGNPKLDGGIKFGTSANTKDSTEHTSDFMSALRIWERLGVNWTFEKNGKQYSINELLDMSEKYMENKYVESEGLFSGGITEGTIYADPNIWPYFSVEDPALKQKFKAAADKIYSSYLKHGTFNGKPVSGIPWSLKATGDPNAIFVENTATLALLYLKAGEVEKYRSLLDGVANMQDLEGKYYKGSFYRYHTINEHTWTSDTAWMATAYLGIPAFGTMT